MNRKIITISLVALSAAMVAILIGGSSPRRRATSGTFTADNLIATQSIKLNTATPSTLTAFDSSKLETSYSMAAITVAAS